MSSHGPLQQPSTSWEIAYHPPTCRPHAIGMDDSLNSRQQVYTPLENNDTIVSRLAQQDKIPWYSKPNLRLLYLLMLPTCIGVEMTSGFDASMINGLQAVPSWLEYYGHPQSAALGLMASMYSLGCVAAVPFAPSLVNKVGRRYPILFAGMLSIVGGILQGFSLNFMMFIIARFVLGFSNVFCVLAASSLVGELSHPKERAIMGSLFLTSFDLGATAAGGATLWTFAMSSNWGWRIPSLLQIVPSLLQVSFIWFVPESPRWLLSKKRGCEAFAILVKYHAEGDKDSGFVKAEYNQMERALEAELKISKMNPGDVLSTPGMRKRVIVATFLGLFVQWCGVGLISMYLSLILEGIGIHDNRTKNVINLTKYSWSFMNGVIMAFIAPRYPRRSVYLTCTISLFVIFVAWTVASADSSLTHSKVSSQIAVVLIFVYSLAYNLGFTALTYTFLVELFPFYARARGIAVYQWSCRIGGFICSFVDPIGINAMGWRWYILYSVWNLFQVVFVYVMFPETSGRTLEELIFLYEEDREAFRRAEIQGLSERGETTRTYGTMDENPADSEQG